MSEQLPEGWSAKSLGELAQIVSGGTPARTLAEFWDGGTIAWATPTDITGTQGKYISETAEKITEKGLQSCSASLLPAGTILMTSRATLGEAKISQTPVCTNQGFKSLIANPGVSNEFLYYQIQRMKVQYARFGSGSTFLEVGKKDTAAFSILIPTEPLQGSVVQVLDLIDTQIEATEALIAKQERLRAGLMQDLFTRGVGENGKLRPPREEAPHLYYESELGWVPKDWEVGPLSRWASRVTYGFTNPMPTSADGPFMVTAADVGDGKIFLRTCRRTTLYAYNNLLSAKSRPKIGDILLTKDGTLGRTALVEDEDVCVNQSVAVITPKDLDDSRYLFITLRTPRYQARLLADAGGSTIKHIYITVVENMLFSVPRSPRERDAIVTICNTEWAIAEQSKESLAKLKRQKSALMHDLLTGKVSVAPLLEKEPA